MIGQGDHQFGFLKVNKKDRVEQVTGYPGLELEEALAVKHCGSIYIIKYTLKFQDLITNWRY